MVQNNDILQITTFASFQQDDVLNVFHYQYNFDGPQNPSLADVATAWGTAFDTAINPALSAALVYDRVKIDNLTDGVEFTEGSFDTSGDLAGETLPAHDTISFKLVRQNKLTRNGRKSFSGIIESFQTNGILSVPQVNIDDMETFLGQPLELNIASVAPEPVFLNPVIVGRTKDVNGVYQLDLGKINFVQDAIMNPNVRTQRSRQRT